MRCKDQRITTERAAHLFASLPPEPKFTSSPYTYEQPLSKSWKREEYEVKKGLKTYLFSNSAKINSHYDSN